MARKPKRKGPKGQGLVDAIHKAFAEGYTTFADIQWILEKRGKLPAYNTLRSQLTLLRQKAGLTDRSNGPIATIKRAFAEGNLTVAKVTAYLDEHGVEASPATIRTQVGLLRRQAGIVRKPKRRAA